MEKRTVRVIIEPKRSGRFNMARDTYFLNLLSSNPEHPSIFTLYSFFPPAITIGKFQRTDEFSEILRGKNVDIVRRPTGGRAVYHLNDITYSFVSSVRYGFKRGRVRETYALVNEILLNALTKLGIDTGYAGHGLEKPGRDFKAHCFAAIHSSDISFNGRKICGSALVWKKDAFLQHGSMFLNFPEHEYMELFGYEQTEKLKERIISLREIIPEIKHSDILGAFLESFKENGFSTITEALSESEIEKIRELERFF
jgi:lipoate-protein ligase A